MEEVGEVQAGKVVDGLEGEGQDLIHDAEFDGKPVELLKSTAD